VEYLINVFKFDEKLMLAQRVKKHVGCIKMMSETPKKQKLSSLSKVKMHL